MAKATPTKSGKRQVTIDVPDALYDRLNAEADARGVALKWLLARLVTEASENLAPPENFSLTGSMKPAAEPAPDATT